MEIIVNQERTDEPKRMHFVSINRVKVEAASLDSANARAKRWEARYNEERRLTAKLQKELEDKK